MGWGLRRQSSISLSCNDACACKPVRTLALALKLCIGGAGLGDLAVHQSCNTTHHPPTTGSSLMLVLSKPFTWRMQNIFCARLVLVAPQAPAKLPSCSWSNCVGLAFPVVGVDRMWGPFEPG